MPKRTDIKSVLIIGAGPIIIGQACEFDYSGVQACKALREEGYKVILVNSNPATIMTDPGLADATYIEPITWQSLEKIIKIEKPDAILPTMGGQTGLNVALDLNKKGILKKYNIELIGATKEAIDKAEDRELFAAAMEKIGLKVPLAKLAHNIEECWEVQQLVGYPCIIRPNFTLGGSGGGIAYNSDEFEEICHRGLDLSPTSELYIDKYLAGWKEYEMEVVRDKADNCIIICSIENFDPMGVHTGDSITVAPAQTLTDKEYQMMRNASMSILREIGVETGGSNVQFAINPEDGEMVVIEMNPRVSRSSALASKATGFPIAKIAAKLAVGFTLDELQNDISKDSIPASFEPTIDYVVTKIPRFNFEKFAGANPTLTSQMKSVGEVMAIGSNFKESLQKAMRGLEIGSSGFESPEQAKNIKAIKPRLITPTPERLWFIGEAFRKGMDINEIQAFTGIDLWFLKEVQEIINYEKIIKSKKFLSSKDLFLEAKKIGFSDKRIAELTGKSEKDIRAKRRRLKIKPVFKRVDTCAAEFETSTAYMYSTYQDECESNPTKKKKIMVLGGGPNRIGQGIEFDYCCVHAAQVLKEEGFETIMVNCNPETVSTDYDTSDRLYFEPITLEDVLEIYEVEKPKGLIIQYGGQTPLKLAKDLEKNGVPILGTSPDQIDLSEDRSRFQKFVKENKLLQPANGMASNNPQAIKIANRIGYPVVVRPSYVLGGRAMEIVYDDEDLKKYLTEALDVDTKNPVLIDKFLDLAIEFDVEAISDGKTHIICGVLQHIEQAGVHSGDSACSIPPYSIDKKLLAEIEATAIKVIKNMKISGLVNIQLAYANEKIYLLEVNPRASRTIPFVSKAIGSPLAKIAAQVMSGKSLKNLGITKFKKPKFYSVKEAVLPFEKFQAVDPILGPEMRSTGEVMGIAPSFVEAFEKAEIAAGVSIPLKGSAFLSVRNTDKTYLKELAKSLTNSGFKLVATRGTARDLEDMGFKVKKINKVLEGRPHIVDLMKNKEISLVVNTTEGRESITDSASIRRTALDQKICSSTTIEGARAICKVIENQVDWRVKKLQDIH
ncbi:carbamoyl-phosphate synthase large subunit [Gammaproteobacteria bacterium]|nr:carbamoyl-phosphate synthase large subunit [Gammaproteobacteria bacterium]